MARFSDLLTEEEKSEYQRAWDSGRLHEGNVDAFIERVLNAPNAKDAFRQAFDTSFGASVRREWHGIKQGFADPRIGVEAFKEHYREKGPWMGTLDIGWSAITTPIRSWNEILAGEEGLGEKPLETLVGALSVIPVGRAGAGLVAAGSKGLAKGALRGGKMARAGRWQGVADTASRATRSKIWRPTAQALEVGDVVTGIREWPLELIGEGLLETTSQVGGRLGRLRTPRSGQDVLDNLIENAMSIKTDAPIEERLRQATTLINEEALQMLAEANELESIDEAREALIGSAYRRYQENQGIEDADARTVAEAEDYDQLTGSSTRPPRPWSALRREVEQPIEKGPWGTQPRTEEEVEPAEKWGWLSPDMVQAREQQQATRVANAQYAQENAEEFTQFRNEFLPLYHQLFTDMNEVIPNMEADFANNINPVEELEKGLRQQEVEGIDLATESPAAAQARVNQQLQSLLGDELYQKYYSKPPTVNEIIKDAQITTEEIRRSKREAAIKLIEETERKEAEAQAEQEAIDAQTQLELDFAAADDAFTQQQQQQQASADDRAAYEQNWTEFYVDFTGNSVEGANLMREEYDAGVRDPLATRYQELVDQLRPQYGTAEAELQRAVEERLRRQIGEKWYRRFREGEGHPEIDAIRTEPPAEPSRPSETKTQVEPEPTPQQPTPEQINAIVDKYTQRYREADTSNVEVLGEEIKADFYREMNELGVPQQEAISHYAAVLGNQNRPAQEPETEPTPGLGTEKIGDYTATKIKFVPWTSMGAVEPMDAYYVHGTDYDYANIVIHKKLVEGKPGKMWVSANLDTGMMIDSQQRKTRETALKAAFEKLDQHGEDTMNRMVEENMPEGRVRPQPPELETTGEQTPQTEETPQTQEPPPQTYQPLADTPNMRLAAWVANKIAAEQEISRQDLIEAANAEFGGTFAEGAYELRQAYDAVEAGGNQFINEVYTASIITTLAEETSRAADASAFIREIQKSVEAYLPTPTRRDYEQITSQQFSTPYHYAYATNWVANIKPDDIILEPSAGTGNLAWWGRTTGSEVHVNEISDRRLAILRESGFENITNYDARQINNLMKHNHPDFAPTVVVMNPPFSADTKAGTKDEMLGANMVTEALKLLRPGGRLVAIVSGGSPAFEDSKGMAFDGSKQVQRWWDNTRQDYEVRANIKVSGKDYVKFGTQFDTRLLVIDKPIPGQTITDTPIAREVETVAELPAMLEQIRNERIDTQVSSTEPTGDSLQARIDAAATERRRARRAQKAQETPETQPTGDNLQARIDAAATERRRARRAQKEREDTLSDITAEQREDFEIWREIAIEQQVAYYQELENLSEDQQAFLDALETPAHNLTAEQQEDYAIWEEIAVEQQVAYYQELDTLSEDQQAFLDALQAYQTTIGVIDATREQPGSEPTSEDITGTGVTTGRGTGPESAVRTPGTVVRDGQQPGTPEQDVSGRQPVSTELVGDTGQTTDTGGAATQTGDERTGLGTSVSEPARTPGQGTVRTDGGTDRADDREGRATTLDAYTPIPHKHVGSVQLVTSKNLAAIPSPSTADVDVDVPRPDQISDAQMAQVKQILRIHEQFKAGDTDAIRKGYALAYGTGTGKTRIFSTVIIHNQRKGRNRHFVLTKNWDLFKKFKKDFGILGGDTDAVFRQDKVLGKDKFPDENGVFISTYSTLRSPGSAENKQAKRKGRLEQVLTWLVGATPPNSVLGAAELGTGMERLLQLAQNNEMPGTLRAAATFFEDFEDTPGDIQFLIDSYNFDLQQGNAKALERHEKKYTTMLERLEEIAQETDEVMPASEWHALASQFDGTIILDESHLAKNVGVDDDKDAAAQAVVAQALISLLPNARIIYSSATTTTKLVDAGYLERLSLFGPGTPYPTFAQFHATFDKKVGMQELGFAQLKAKGEFDAATLDMSGVEYDKVEHVMTEDQIKDYNMLVDIWHEIQDAVGDYIQSNKEAAKRANASARFGGEWSVFWSANQRFWIDYLMSVQLNTVLDKATELLEAGDKVVFRLVNTGEASQDRQIERARARGEDVADAQLTLVEPIIRYLEKTFPTAAMHAVQDPRTGKTVYQKVTDGNTVVEDVEMAALRDDILRSVNDISMPPPAIDILVQGLRDKGYEVAEISGRKERYVWDNNTGERIKEDNIQSRKEGDIERFLSGDLKALVFSEAGGTGQDYHALEGQPQHHLFVVQTGWNMENLEQGVGRVHRTGQSSEPTIRLAGTDAPAEARSTMTALQHMRTMGAQVMGSEETGAARQMFGTGVEQYIGTDLGLTTLRGMFREMSRKQEQFEITGIQDAEGNPLRVTPMQILDHFGMLTTNQDGSKTLDEKKLKMETFLNRVMNSYIEVQRAVFNKYLSVLKEAVEAAQSDGTLDKGAEVIDTVSAKVISETPLATDAASGAKTNLVEIDAEVENPKRTWEQLTNRIENSPDTGVGQFYGFFRLVQGAIVAAFRGADQMVENKAVARVRLVKVAGKDEFLPQNDSRITNAKQLGREITPQIQQEWQTQYDAIPDTTPERIHIATGLVPDNWRRLSLTENVARTLTLAERSASTQIVRVQLDNGDSVLGKYVPEGQVPSIYADFGVDTQVTPTETTTARQTPVTLLENILGGENLQLENNWTLALTTRDGTPIIILRKGQGPVQESREMESMGLRSISGSSGLEWFVPYADSSVLEALLKRYPPRDGEVDFGGQQSEPQSTPEAPALQTSEEILSFLKTADLQKKSENDSEISYSIGEHPNAEIIFVKHGNYEKHPYVSKSTNFRIRINGKEIIKNRYGKNVRVEVAMNEALQNLTLENVQEVFGEETTPTDTGQNRVERARAIRNENPGMSIRDALARATNEMLDSSPDALLPTQEEIDADIAAMERDASDLNPHLEALGIDPADWEIWTAAERNRMLDQTYDTLIEREINEDAYEMSNKERRALNALRQDDTLSDVSTETVRNATEADWAAAFPKTKQEQLDTRKSYHERVKTIIDNTEVPGVKATLQEVSDRLWKGEYFALQGHVLRSDAEAALLAQFIRNPMTEHTLILLMRGDTVVGSQWLSLGKEEETTAGNVGELRRMIQQRKATSIIRIHNHPSKIARFGNRDKMVAKKWFDNLEIPLKREIILNTGEYAVAERAANGKIAYRERVKLDTSATDGTPAAAAIGAFYKTPNNWTTLLMSDADGKILSAVDVHGLLDLEAGAIRSAIFKYRKAAEANNVHVLVGRGYAEEGANKLREAVGEHEVVRSIWLDGQLMEDRRHVLGKTGRDREDAPTGEDILSDVVDDIPESDSVVIPPNPDDFAQDYRNNTQFQKALNTISDPAGGLRQILGMKSRQGGRLTRKTFSSGFGVLEEMSKTDRDGADKIGDYIRKNILHRQFVAKSQFGRDAKRLLPPLRKLEAYATQKAMPKATDKLSPHKYGVRIQIRNDISDQVWRFIEDNKEIANKELRAIAVELKEAWRELLIDGTNTMIALTDELKTLFGEEIYITNSNGDRVVWYPESFDGFEWDAETRSFKRNEGTKENPQWVHYSIEEAHRKANKLYTPHYFKQDKLRSEHQKLSKMIESMNTLMKSDNPAQHEKMLQRLGIVKLDNKLGIDTYEFEPDGETIADIDDMLEYALDYYTRRELSLRGLLEYTDAGIRAERYGQNAPAGAVDGEARIGYYGHLERARETGHQFYQRDIRLLLETRRLMWDRIGEFMTIGQVHAIKGTSPRLDDVLSQVRGFRKNKREHALGAVAVALRAGDTDSMFERLPQFGLSVEHALQVQQDWRVREDILDKEGNPTGRTRRTEAYQEIDVPRMNLTEEVLDTLRTIGFIKKNQQGVDVIAGDTAADRQLTLARFFHEFYNTIAQRESSVKDLYLSLGHWHTKDPLTADEAKFWQKVSDLTTISTLSWTTAIQNLAEVPLLTEQTGTRSMIWGIAKMFGKESRDNLKDLAHGLSHVTRFMSETKLAEKYLGSNFSGFSATDRISRAIGLAAGLSNAKRQIREYVRGSEKTKARLRRVFDEIQIDTKVVDTLSAAEVDNILDAAQEQIMSGDVTPIFGGTGNKTERLAWTILKSMHYISDSTFKAYDATSMPPFLNKQTPLVRLFMKYKSWMVQHNAFKVKNWRRAARELRAGNFRPAWNMIQSAAWSGATYGMILSLYAWLRNDDEPPTAMEALHAGQTLGMSSVLLEMASRADGNWWRLSKDMLGQAAGPTGSIATQVIAPTITGDLDVAGKQAVGRIPVLNLFQRFDSLRFLEGYGENPETSTPVRRGITIPEL